MSSSIIEVGLRPTWKPERVLWHIRDPESVVLAAKEGELLVGFAIMQFGEMQAHLNLLGVAATHQRCGVGSSLLHWLEDTARVAGTFLIDLEVRVTNLQAQAFYARLGYEEAGIIKGYYQGVDDALRMQRDVRFNAH